MYQIDEPGLEPVRQARVEVLPAKPQRNPLWPMVGGVLVWAARELLPKVIAVWQASHADVSQPISYKANTSARRTPANRQHGHRHRWRRI